MTVRPTLGTEVPGSEEPAPGLTQLPLGGAHGLHHPDGQGRLQHGDPHVGKADGPWKGSKRGRVLRVGVSRLPYRFQAQLDPRAHSQNHQFGHPELLPRLL